MPKRGDKKEHNALSDDRSNTRRKHEKKNFFVPAGDVSLGNSRVQANGLSNSLSDRKHFYYVSKECVV